MKKTLLTIIAALLLGGVVNAQSWGENPDSHAQPSNTPIVASITVNGETFKYDDVTAAPDMYELHYNEDPYHIESQARPQFMPAGTTMVPRVLKTNIGDIFTTNTINETTVTLGQSLYVGDDGILCGTKGTNSGDMVWQVVKIYTMPDHQKGVKVMRIA